MYDVIIVACCILEETNNAAKNGNKHELRSKDNMNFKKNHSY